MTTISPEQELDVHPFEQSGNGIAPFQFVGFWAAPSKGLQEANPDAYNNAWAGAAACCTGSCSHCGTHIVNHCLIRSSDGRLFAVGTDCVEKTDQDSLRDPVKKALANHQRTLRQARAQARRVAAQARYNAIHGERLAREAAECGVREEALKIRTARAAKILERVAACLHDGRGGFRDSVATGMKSGQLPTGRGLSITLDILGTFGGRYNSEGYWKAYERAEGIFEDARKALLP